jgi:glutamine synthetase
MLERDFLEHVFEQERLTRSSLAKELFGAEFIEGYIASKTLEMTSFFNEITPWERRVLAAQA